MSDNFNNYANCQTIAVKKVLISFAIKAPIMIADRVLQANEKFIDCNNFHNYFPSSSASIT